MAPLTLGPLPRWREGIDCVGERGQISILRVIPVFGGPVFYGSGDF